MVKHVTQLSDQPSEALRRNLETRIPSAGLYYCCSALHMGQNHIQVEGPRGDGGALFGGDPEGARAWTRPRRRP